MTMPRRLTKGLARHAVPIMLLARLAVSSGSQGQGIGAGLLKDAMLRTLQAADIAGIRAWRSTPRTKTPAGSMSISDSSRRQLTRSTLSADQGREIRLAYH